VVWRQIALGLGLFAVYLLVAAWPGDRQALADRNSRNVFGFEQRLHLDVEVTVNSWLAPHHVWSTLANYEYAYTYILSALIAFVWLIVRRPSEYRRLRDSFIVLNLLAFACFALYPVTPPRMLSELSLVDTVTRGRTVGSWGSGLVDHANQLAAMPSLHVAWALWVSAVLARLSARRLVQVVSAVHVALTVLVVVATANHYVLDAVAAFVLVPLSTRIADLWHARRRETVVQPADAFFLHVERTGAAQHVGGLALFEPGDGPSVEAMRDLVTGELGELPRFRQRVVISRWRRPRWVDADPLDWSWHITERLVDDASGVRQVVADLATTALPRDRPLWRIVLVRDAARGGSALVLLMHHTIADGIGTVLQALRLMRPRIELPPTAPAPGRTRLALGTVRGLAQLATDGRPAPPPPWSQRRGYATTRLDLDTARDVASRHDVRVTELLLALTATAASRAAPDLAGQVRGTLRISVPLMMRDPGSTAEGNATAAVMVDVPVGPSSVAECLAAVGHEATRLRTPTRALASRFVMAGGLRLLPEPCVGWFARAVYGGRFFHAIVSNMPGPATASALSMAGTRIDEVYPILPLAAGAPIALGALSWSGALGIGVATDPALVDAELLATEMASALDELTQGSSARAGSGTVVP